MFLFCIWMWRTEEGIFFLMLKVASDRLTRWGTDWLLKIYASTAGSKYLLTHLPLFSSLLFYSFVYSSRRYFSREGTCYFFIKKNICKYTANVKSSIGHCDINDCDNYGSLTAQLQPIIDGKAVCSQSFFFSFVESGLFFIQMYVLGLNFDNPVHEGRNHWH